MVRIPRSPAKRSEARAKRDVPHTATTHPQRSGMYSQPSSRTQFKLLLRLAPFPIPARLPSNDLRNRCGSSCHSPTSSRHIRAGPPNTFSFHGNIEATGAEAVDLPIPEGRQPSNEHPFKGNIDLKALETHLQSRAQDVPCIMMTGCGPTPTLPNALTRWAFQWSSRPEGMRSLWTPAAGFRQNLHPADKPPAFPGIHLHDDHSALVPGMGFKLSP